MNIQSLRIAFWNYVFKNAGATPETYFAIRAAVPRTATCNCYKCGGFQPADLIGQLIVDRERRAYLARN